MRFLKLVPGHGPRSKSVIDFTGNHTVIDPSKDNMLRNSPDSLRNWIAAMAGGRQGEHLAGMTGGELLIESGRPAQKYKLVSDSKKTSVYSRDNIHGNYTGMVYDNTLRPGRVPGIAEFFTPEDLLLLSYHDPESIEQGIDPLFSGRRLSSVLLRKEMAGISPLFISGIDGLSPVVERELNTLSREIQLLELKKMKNDKLKKEIAHSSRNISRLNRQAESFENYKSVLAEIKKKNEHRDKLSHRISETKKDLIELREIGEKIHSLEKDLKKRFPQFYNETSEGLPDMDRIQELFNSVRDWNEKIDLFFQKRRSLAEKVLKVVIALLIFVFFSSIFITVKSVRSGAASVKPLLIIASVSALVSAAGIAAYFRIRKKAPAALLETKKERENALLEVLHKNNFPVDDFKTGELYDFLFQYFEDFITFRDIRNELADLRKKISSTVAYTEKEKKLDSLKIKVEETDAAVREMFAGLDADVYPVPEIRDIDHALSELNEKISETGSGIIHEKSIMARLEEQLNERSEPDVNLLEIEAEISDIRSRMEELRNEAGAVKLLEETWREVSAPFMQKNKGEFILVFRTFMQRLVPDIKDEALSEIENFLLDDKLQMPGMDMSMKCAVSIAARCALSVYFREAELPPAVFVEPFALTGQENVEERDKILLELSGTRQVIIFSAGNNSRD